MKTAKIAELVAAVGGLDDPTARKFQQACESTRPARAAAASVLSDRIAIADGWTVKEITKRLPAAMQSLNDVTRGSTLGQLSTEQRTALSDAIVAVIWRELADMLGARLVTTLTLPFREIGLAV